MLEPTGYVNIEMWKSGKYHPDDCFSEEPMEGDIAVYTLPDLLVALRQVTPEMMLAGTNAMDYARLAPEANRIVVADICFQAMLSAFERQVEGEK